MKVTAASSRAAVAILRHLWSPALDPPFEGIELCSHPNLAISKVGVGSARRSEGERSRSALEDLPVREQAGPRCGEGLAAYPTELIEHLIEHAEPFVELIAGDRQRGRNDDHVPVGHQVEAALHRRLGELRNRRKRLSGGIEGN